MAAGRHFKIYKNRNNLRTVDPNLAKFGMELQLDAAPTADGSKTSFFKIQDVRRRKTEIYQKFNNFKTVRPICAKFVIHQQLRN